MAVRKKKTTRARNGTDSAADRVVDSLDESAGAEDLGPPAGFERARLSFGKNEELIRMKVMRVTQDGSEESLQTFEFDPETHDEDFLRDRFGSGRYRLRFLGADWGYKMVLTVRVGDIPGASPVDPVPLPGAPFDPLPYFMREAEKSREQFNTMVVAMLGKSDGGGGNEALVALIKAQSEQNTALLEKLVNRGGSSSSDGVDTVLKALELGMTAVSDIKVDSDGGWVSALRGVAKDLGPVLQQLIAQKQGAGVVPPPGPAGGGQLPPGAVAPPAQVTPTSSVQPSEVFRGLLTRYAPIALQVAREGQPPVEFAGQLLDSIGVNFHPLFDSLQAHDLVALQPELGGVMWKNPVDGTDTRWIDEVVQLLHTRDWGVAEETEEATKEATEGA